MSVKRLDIVKLGEKAQETHTVVGDPHGGRVAVKQHTTGAVRYVSLDRIVVIGHHDDRTDTDRAALRPHPEPTDSETGADRG
jgi:hypothetical protein